MTSSHSFDVVIIGGSYAGLSAAMALGRALRTVLIIDSGLPCNRQTPHSHNFLTRDGNTPAQIAAIGKEQVLRYDTVTFMTAIATRVEGENNRFTVHTQSGKTVQARKLIFTTGIKDQLPAIPGLAECWGISVIHCPFCHGYEYKHEPTGILINGDKTFEFARFIRNWSVQLTVFTNGPATIPADHRQALADRKISIVEMPLQGIEHNKGYLNTILLTDGTKVPLKALYARLPFEQHCPIPQQLGCAFTDMGYIQVNDMQQTTVPGVYAAGDNASAMRSVSGAVATGTKAGAAVVHELVSA